MHVGKQTPLCSLPTHAHGRGRARGWYSHDMCDGCLAAGGNGRGPKPLMRQGGAGGSWVAQRGLSPLLDVTDCSEEFGDCITDEDQVPFY